MALLSINSHDTHTHTHKFITQIAIFIELHSYDFKNNQFNWFLSIKQKLHWMPSREQKEKERERVDEDNFMMTSRVLSITRCIFFSFSVRHHHHLFNLVAIESFIYLHFTLLHIVALTLFVDTSNIPNV